MNEKENKVEEFMNKVIDEYEHTVPEEDKEFDKYAKLYEEKFNKRAYIPEPNGIKEFAVECIKKCLSENKDMLDELYYPNFEKDMGNDILYSKSKKDINNDKFVWKEGEIKIAHTQCEFCKYNNKEYPNVCSQYPNGKPTEVISNIIKCSKLYDDNVIHL